MSIESVILSNHLTLFCPLLLLPSIFPSIKVFSNELALHIRWPKYWSFSFSISPSMNIQGWFPLELTGLASLQFKGLSRVFSSTKIWKHQFFGAQPSLWSNSPICTWLLKQAGWSTGYGSCLWHEGSQFQVPDEPPRWKVVARPWKTLGFLASRGEEFNLGPVTKLDHSELLHDKVLLKYERDGQSFWHRHQKGAERVPPC